MTQTLQHETLQKKFKISFLHIFRFRIIRLIFYQILYIYMLNDRSVITSVLDKFGLLIC